MSVGVLPSLAIGAVAFGAGELIFHTAESKNLKNKNRTLYDTLIDAKRKNNEIMGMIPKIEDETLKKHIKEINQSVTKIINTIEKKPLKYKNVENFFDYYLPVTLKILRKYDEIENQRLSSKEGLQFMDQAASMMEKINNAFKNQLSNLYQSDIVDADAEMKVFETMLKADGYDTSDDFKVNKNKEGI